MSSKSASAGALALLLLLAASWAGPAAADRVSEVAPHDGGAVQAQAAEEDGGGDGFDALDLDGDGVVTRAEWEQVAEAAAVEAGAPGGGSGGGVLMEEQSEEAVAKDHCCRCNGQLKKLSNCVKAGCKFVHGGKFAKCR